MPELEEPEKNQGTALNVNGLLSEILGFLLRLVIEADEDSCMGMAHVVSRISEDELCSLIKKIELAVR